MINQSIRTVFAFVLLLIAARFMGRKPISRMTFFDFAVGIILGRKKRSMASTELIRLMGVNKV